MAFLTAGAAAFALISVAGCNKINSTSTQNSALTTYQDSVSYVIGSDIGSSLKDIKDDVKLDIIIQGIQDKLNEKELKISGEQAGPIMQKFSMQMRDKQMAAMKAKGEKNLAEGKKFLEENKTKSGVVTTPSGLQYIILSKGNGQKPKESDKVKVNYKGVLLDGKEFDSSYKRGTPAEFPINGVIKGWTEALLLMDVGSKYKIFVPSELAYGERGAGPDIGPNTVLTFEIELLEILK